MPDGVPLNGVNDSLYARALDIALASNGAVSYQKLRDDTDLTEYLREIALVQVDAFTSRYAGFLVTVPVGGLCFMAGWVLLAIAAWRAPKA